MSLKAKWLSGLGAFTLMCSSTLASPSGEATRAALEGKSGPLATAAGQLAAAAAKGEADARFGQGALLFARAVERYGQSQYRHGFRLPSSSRGLLPFLRMPVPDNPSPEPLSYEAQRATLAAFLADLDAAAAALAQVKGETKITIDLNAVRLDLTATGDPAKGMSLGDVLRGMRGGARPQAAGTPQPAAGEWLVGFDTADALWLQGYANLLAAGVEFALAHDWRESFAILAPRFYPRVEGAALPLSRDADPTIARVIIADDREIADFVAFAHSIRWPVVEPARMAKARERLLACVALSRASWKAILAETDDEHEWVPSPRQKNAAVTFAPVTQTQVDGWLAALDDFEAALQGRKLVGHWRLRQGFDLSKVFTEPRPFDLVLWMTGHAAAPYLREGPTLSQDAWRRWNAMLNGNFLGYAVWFN